MSTRAVIALKTGPTNFAGVYHQWDGYPDGLGKTLWEMAHDQFDQNLDAMLALLIDEHPAGWSTINGADWSKEPGFTELANRQCGICGRRDEEHWEQYEKYQARATVVPLTTRSNSVLGHVFERRPDRRAECFCHGDRHETRQVLTEANASGCGCEWAYVFEPDSRTMHVLKSYTRITGKLEPMIGAWGVGDPDGWWSVVASVALDGEEPDWEAMKGEAYARGGWER